MTEIELMQKIKSVCGSWIDEAVADSIYPASFLAALTANESGGDPAVSRLEPKVFSDLSAVLIGVKPAYGSIGGADLLTYVLGTTSAAIGRVVQNAVTSLRHLATSWGPTQIMGYQALAGHYDMADLPNLQKHYVHAIAMLEDFRRRFSLPAGPSNDSLTWSEFFRCWNTGRPNGQTADPTYVGNGLNRMDLYRTL
jgi:hypothetical protein